MGDLTNFALLHIHEYIEILEDDGLFEEAYEICMMERPMIRSWFQENIPFMKDITNNLLQDAIINSIDLDVVYDSLKIEHLKGRDCYVCKKWFDMEAMTSRMVCCGYMRLCDSCAKTHDTECKEILNE